MASLPTAVVALGMFDGMHTGHRALLTHAIALANEQNALAAVYTFSNHPLDVMGGRVKLLSTTRERNAILRDIGAEEIVSEPFTSELAHTAPEAFVDMLLERWRVDAFVVGFNYTFGARGAGTPDTLIRIGERRGFYVEVVPPVRYEGAPVSSSRIREALSFGEVERAKAMLGRRYTLSGRVVRNKRIGRRIGFPTANIEPDARIMLPQNGVYATYAYVGGGAYRAVTNIGTNPTVGGEKLTIESHLIDFDGDIYAQTLTIGFRFRIRDEETFASVDALKARITLDREIASTHLK